MIYDMILEKTTTEPEPNGITMCPLIQRYESQLIASIIRQAAPLEQKPEQVNLHVLLPEHLARPFAPGLGDPLPGLDVCLHASVSLLSGFAGVLVRHRPLGAGEIRQCAQQAVEADVDGHEMLPCEHAAVPPLAEHGRLEDQAAAAEKGQEATAEAGAVEVDEEPMAPMVLEIRLVRQPELARLVAAVIVPAARDTIHEGDVKVEAERGGREKPVRVRCWLRGVREEDGEWVGGIVGKVDETLTRHSFPGCVSGEAF